MQIISINDIICALNISLFAPHEINVLASTPGRMDSIKMTLLMEMRMS